MSQLHRNGKGDQVNRAHQLNLQFILLGGWAAGFFGVAGSVALVTSAFSAMPPGSDYVSSLRSLGIAPAALAFWLALPSLCVTLGATVFALSRRRNWLHLAGEAQLLIGIVADAGLGWYAVTGASWPIIALFGAALVLSITVGVAFIVGEIGGERVNVVPIRGRENIRGE